MADKNTNVSNLVTAAQAQKLIAFVVAALGGVVAALAKDGHVGWGTILAAAIALVGGAPAVFHPTNPVVKGALAFGAAALSALALYVSDASGWSSVNPSDWLIVLGTGIGAVLAIYVPNAVPNANPGSLPAASDDDPTVVTGA